MGMGAGTDAVRAAARAAGPLRPGPALLAAASGVFAATDGLLATAYDGGPDARADRARPTDAGAGAHAHAHHASAVRAHADARAPELRAELGAAGSRYISRIRPALPKLRRGGAAA